MENVVGKDGNPNIAHTVHVLEPIYPKAELDRRKNVNYMRAANYNMWVKVYEEVYGKKLTLSPVPIIK